VKLATFGRTSRGIVLSANELECVGRAAILQAQPIADKEKSPWNRRLTLLGCRPA